MTPFHGPPATPPVVPGFTPATLLGAGGHGVVWAAREQISGDLVALKIGTARRQAQGDTASHEADLLARLDHPHVVRLRRVVEADDGSTVLVLDLAAGGSLAALVAARGLLDPGEVVTLLVPLASALSELHVQGLAHGDLSPGNVLFSADGRPMIGDLGVGSVLGSRAGKEWSTPGFADPAIHDDAPASDVWGLGAIAWFALTGGPPDGALDPPSDDLSALISECLDPDPARRPAIDDIGIRAWEAATPEPIRFSSAAVQPVSWTNDAPEPLWPAPDPALRLATMPSSAAVADAMAKRRRRKRAGLLSRWRHRAGTLSRPGAGLPSRWRPLAGGVAGFLVTAAVALAVFLITASPAAPRAGGSADPGGSAKPAPRDPAGQAELAGALASIAQARAAAFHTVSAAPLARADEPGSAAEEQDKALVQRLRTAGVRLDGVSYRITDVQLHGPMADVVDVDAVVTTSAYRQVPTGASTSTVTAPAQDVAASGPSAVRLRLVRSSGGWLVRSVKLSPSG